MAVALVVFAALLRGLVWAVALPPWQGPDEPAHFSYVQRIATNGTIPLLDHSLPEYFSVSLQASVYSSGFERSRTREPLRKLRRDLPIFPSERDDLSQINHGGLDVGNYPPAYYLLAVPAYQLPFLHTDTERMYAVRFVSTLIGALAVWLVFLLLIEAGASFLIALLGSLTYSLLPMVSQASANGNPDILLMVALAGLARSLLILRRGWTTKGVIQTCAWAALAALSKPIGGPAAGVMIVGMLAFGIRAPTRRRRLTGGVALVVMLGICYAAMAAAAGWALFGRAGPLSGVRYGLSYLWRFYLPALPFQNSADAAYGAFHSMPSWRVWVETGIGSFGWLAAPLPAWSYNLAFWMLLTSVGIAIWACAKRREQRESVVPALLGAAVSNVLLLHLAEVLMLLQPGGGLLLQGRYLIPVIPVFAAALYQPLSRIGWLGVATASALMLTAAVLSVQALDTVLVFFD